MFLKQLNLTNFRNYSALNLAFDNRPTILVGNNGVGKTNLLEAVYFLSTTKSLRVEMESELIKNREVFSRVEGRTEEDGETDLAIVLQYQDSTFSKKAMVNGIGRRVVDYLGNLPAVLFAPSDINLVVGAPALRRWHLDLGLAQVDQAYKKALTSYEQFLTARNRVLKRIREGEGKINELDYWTIGLLENGQIISDKRKKFFEFTQKLPKILGNFKFEYQPSELSKEKLQETNGREVAAATTLIGPHRDDFDIVILNSPVIASQFTLSVVEGWQSSQQDPSLVTQDSFGRSLSRFGSRGEQRMGTLAFKLAQFEYMAHVLGKRPILLLDDVFSELDENHRNLVGEIALKQQTIISTVEMSEIPNNLLDKARILQVENGKIT